MWVERIRRDHPVSDFHCGKKPLDDWLARHAIENDERRLSAVSVLTDGSAIIGYFSLTMGGLRAADLPPRLGRGLPPRIDIGAVLLGRLAVDVRWQSQGIGLNLLATAVATSARAAAEVSARFIAVDPLDDEARRWYAKHGFREIANTGRMYVKLSDAIAAFVDDE